MNGTVQGCEKGILVEIKYVKHVNKGTSKSDLEICAWSIVGIFKTQTECKDQQKSTKMKLCLNQSKCQYRGLGQCVFGVMADSGEVQDSVCLV